MAIKVMIADPDPCFFQEINNSFAAQEKLSVIAGSIEAAELDKIIKKEEPRILLLGPGWDRDKLSKILIDYRKKYPRLMIILAVMEKSDLDPRAIEGGVDESVILPIESFKLWQTIQRLVSGKESKSLEKKRRPGKIITVFSTKGGVGKSVVAVNLAVALAKTKQAENIILDLDLQFGDVGVMLKQKPKYTIADLLANPDDFDPVQVRSILTEYQPGIKTLLAPLQPELADLISPRVVAPVCKNLKELADFVIVDTPPSFNDNVLHVLDNSDYVILVGVLDLPSIKNIKLCLQTMKLLGYPTEKIKLVLNRVEKGVGLTVTEIEGLLKVDICQTIPNDKTVLLSVNKGTPVTIEAPKSEASKSLFDLARVFLTKQQKILVSA